MNMYLMISKWNGGVIVSDNTSYKGYYIIRFSSSIYALQADFNINGQVISSG